MGIRTVRFILERMRKTGRTKRSLERRRNKGLNYGHTIRKKEEGDVNYPLWPRKKEKERIKGRWKKKHGSGAKAACGSTKVTIITGINYGIRKKWECKISTSFQKKEKKRKV